MLTHKKTEAINATISVFVPRSQELGDAAQRNMKDVHRQTSYSQGCRGGRGTGAIPQWDGVQRECTVCPAVCVCVCICSGVTPCASSISLS